MEVALQNALFKYFSTTLAAIILEAKRSGRWDMGILGESLLRNPILFLGTKVVLQNALFKYFSTTLAAIILEAKRSGRWDMGILGKIFHESTVKAGRELRQQHSIVFYLSSNISPQLGLPLSWRPRVLGDGTWGFQLKS